MTNFNKTVPGAGILLAVLVYMDGLERWMCLAKIPSLVYTWGFLSVMGEGGAWMFENIYDQFGRPAWLRWLLGDRDDDPPPPPPPQPPVDPPAPPPPPGCDCCGFPH